MVTAWVIVAVIAALVWLLTDTSSEPDGPAPVLPGGEQSQPSSVGAPLSHPPRVRVRRVGHALDAVERACSQATAPISRRALSAPVHELVSFARRYPNGRFTLAGESGTTLALLTVTRFSLEGCNAELATVVARTVGRLGG